MNKSKLLFFLAFSSMQYLYGEPIPYGKIGFGGGLNILADKTEIADNESPDMCNCVVNLDGTLSKLGGSEPYIDQTISSHPVSALYKAYASTGSTKVKNLIAIVGDKIVISTSDINPVWRVLSSGVITRDQNWSFTTMNNRVIMTGDKLIDPVYQLNLFTSSITNLIDPVGGTTEYVTVKAKYVAQKSNYLLLVNVKISTDNLMTYATYYNDRAYYSLLNSPLSQGNAISSFTWNRFIAVRTNDGEELNGVGIINDEVTFMKKTSIHSLSFSVLHPTRGDQTLRELTNGFGLASPRGLQNTGQFYIIPSQDAIRLYDGGRRSRLTVSEENIPISYSIKPLIDKLIQDGTYRSLVGKYYKKKEWYMLSYYNKDKFPKDRNNSVIIYDIRLRKWYPVCNWLVNVWETFDGDEESNGGQLIYGDSMMGKVHKADLETLIDDSGKSISVNNMDILADWTGDGINRNTANVVEGTGSIRMWINASVTESSMTRMQVLNFGEWYDKTKITTSDKLQFKLHVTSISSITDLRIDLEVNDIENAFDSNFTSVTLTSGSLVNIAAIVPNVFATVEVALSSFPLRPDWTDFDTEEVPFANTLTYYGIRFVVNGINVSSVTIDDVRIIQNKNKNLKNFYIFTKLFDFNKIENKLYGQLLLTLEKSADAVLNVDIFNNFGERIKTIKFPKDIPKEIIVFGFQNSTGVDILDDIDFSIKQSTTFNPDVFLPFNGVANKDFIFFHDRTNSRLVKMDRNPFGSIVSTYGSSGSGTTNFNIPHQHDIDSNNIFVVDLDNQRIKIHKQTDLSFVRASGELSRANTGYHQATGITCNDLDCIVADEGNYRLVKISISTLGFLTSVNLDYNTIGDSTLDQDEDFIYLAYNKISESSVNNEDVVLEKRFRGNMELVSRVRITPKNDVSLSTYSLQGDIALRGRYIYITFTNGIRYYIQKRLKKDFSIVNEHSKTNEFYSVLADPYAHRPTVKTLKQDLNSEGKYIQLKFYDDEIDNNVRLINQTFLYNQGTLKY